jgi:HPt (histidine-containing phosphotransfer) domain-containing protein
MNDNHPQEFRFNDDLDVVFLRELYEGDTRYVTEIFGIFLKDLPAYWDEITTAYEAEKIPELRSAVHKTKTLFGYVGHTKVMEALQAFENKCLDGASCVELTEGFKDLSVLTNGAKHIIEEEHQRLLKFHQS